MSLLSKPTFVTLHRLGQLSGRSRATLLLRMRDGELVADGPVHGSGRSISSEGSSNKGRVKADFVNTFIIRIFA